MNTQEFSTRARQPHSRASSRVMPRMQTSLRLTALAAIGFVALAPTLHAETWTVLSGEGTWSNPVDWTPKTVPNAVGASALLASDQVPNRTISVAGNFAVSEIAFDNRNPG